MAWALLTVCLLAQAPAVKGHDPGPPHWPCLTKMTPSVALVYPEDAPRHYVEVHTAMQEWVQRPGHVPHRDAVGFQGPWIENEWITHFRARLLGDAAAPVTTEPPQDRLTSIFGFYIPLFITWLDPWVWQPQRYPPGFLDRLKSVLRPSVPYVTVSQSDEGLTGRCELFQADFPNILVFSAGGYGHVPVPLYHRPEPPRNPKPIRERAYLASYVGSLDTAPGGFRSEMMRRVRQAGQAAGRNTTYYYGPGWRDVMVDSVVQMGLVPVYVYSDVPWVPYADLFPRVGFVANLTSLPALLRELAVTPPAELRRREALALRLAESHFSAEGVMRQIALFLRGGASDLRCAALPPTPRDGPPCLRIVTAIRDSAVIKFLGVHATVGGGVGLFIVASAMATLYAVAPRVFDALLPFRRAVRPPRPARPHQPL